MFAAASTDDVFWAVQGDVTLPSQSTLLGIVLSQSGITASGGEVTGGLLAQGAITLQSQYVSSTGGGAL